MTEKNKLPKVKEMTNLQEVVQYDNDVSSLIEQYNEQIKSAKENSDYSDMAFFDMGKKLIEVENKIKLDNQENTQKAKKVFAAFKLRISEKINKNISNVDKVFKVAQFCETETYKKYENRLPSGWGTLYLLLSFKKGENGEKVLDTAKIDELMSDEEITKDIQRSKLIKKIADIKTPSKVVTKKVTITIKDGIEPTQEQLNELQQHLNKTRVFKKQWNVTTPEIVKDTVDLSENTNEDNKNE